MPNINAQDLKFDILDRLDSSVLVQELSDSIRKKLSGDLRLVRAINLANLEFARDADTKALSQLVNIVLPTADPNIGASGVVDGMTTYVWPTDAFQERNDGGVVNVILNDYEYSLEEASPLNSVRMQAASTFYGNGQKVFAYDLPRKRLYAPSGLTVETRIIKIPAEITSVEATRLDTDGVTTIDNDLPVDKSYTETLSVLALKELLRMGQSMGPQPEPEAERE